MVDTSTEKEVHLTPKQIGGILVLAGIITNGGNIANIITSGDQIDHELQSMQIEQIIEDDEECQRRQGAIVKDLQQLRELVTTYQSDAKRRDTHNEKMIDECRQQMRYRGR